MKNKLRNKNEDNDEDKIKIDMKIKIDIKVKIDVKIKIDIKRNKRNKGDKIYLRIVIVTLITHKEVNIVTINNIQQHYLIIRKVHEKRERRIIKNSKKWEWK